MIKLCTHGNIIKIQSLDHMLLLAKPIIRTILVG